jgi:hypothetical protein
MKKQFVSVLLVFLAASNGVLAQAIIDTPEARRQQAMRYLQATPPRALFEDMAKKMAANMPPSEQQQFIQRFTSQLDIDALTRAMTEALIRRFTAEELKALADFYGSPVGKSAMSKFGDYMADLMPVVQAETQKAQSKASQSTPHP